MVTYNEQTHSYFLKGKKIPSVTQYINKWIPPFDKENISKAVAKKAGREQQDVLDEWTMKGKISCDYGNVVHNTIEAYLKWGVEPTFKLGNDVLSDFKSKIDTTYDLHPEIVVYGEFEGEMLAGRVDLIAKKSGHIKIIDFKTNGDLNKKNGKLLEPFKDLDNTPLNKYRLQLSLYKHLLGKECDLELWHWGGEEFEIINIKEIDLCQKKR